MHGGESTPLRPDWERIERAFRAGILSIREIAKSNNVSEAGIRKRAKTEGWQRDLTAKVQAAVRTKLTRGSEEAAQHEVRAEREIVEEASETGVQVVLSLRHGERSARDILITLMSQLAAAVGQRDDLERIIVAGTPAADDPAADARSRQADRAAREQLRKAISLPVHFAAMRDATTSLDRLATLAVKVYNLPVAPADTPSPESGDAAPVITDESLAAFQAKLEAVLAEQRDVPGNVRSAQ